MVKPSAMSFLGPRRGAAEGQMDPQKGRCGRQRAARALIGLPVPTLPPSLSLSASSRPALQSASLPLLAFSTRLPLLVR